jgi:excisionase family DNA binding protein
MMSETGGRAQRQMLTIAVVANRLGVSERTVFRWLQKRQLKGFRIGRVLRISEADLEEFIDRALSYQR